jgi:hypothetical protein
MRSAKIEIDTATGFLLGLLALVVIIGIIILIKNLFIGEDLASQIPCWVTNNLKAGGSFFSLIPSCSRNLAEDVDMEKFASLVRGTWWMYLQGEEDLGNAADEIFLAYVFTPKEDISLEEYFKYILSTNHGEKSDIAHSDYAYLEKNTIGQTLCFDKSGEDNSINNFYLEKGKTYYIMFYDDQPPTSIGGDRILISPDPDFDATKWSSKIISTILGSAIGSAVATETPLGTVDAVIGGVVGFNLVSYSNSECLIYSDFVGAE